MPSYNDRWERQKRYLLRNFLVNPGFQLSPIPEEERSTSPSSQDSLPELVVEPEPNRHDHAPEYYEGLTRRMRKYYCQLFLGETASDDEDSSEFEINQSMTSTFILDNNAGEDDAIKYVATHKINDYFDKDATLREMIHELTEEESVDSDKNEKETQHFEAHSELIEEDSSDSDKSEDEFEELEANDLITGGFSADFNEKKDEDEAKDAATEETSPDSDEDELETNDSVSEEKRHDSDKDDNVSEAGNAMNEEISPYSDEDENNSEAKDVSTEEHSSDSHKPESETELNEVTTAEKRADFDKYADMSLNKHLEAIDEDLSKTKSTSDSNESGPCHIVSSTVVEIHQMRPERAAILFENVSPVLGPKFVRVSRGISETDDVGRDTSVALSGEMEVSDEIIEKAADNANEINKDEASIEKLDTEVQRLLSVSEVTNISHDSEPVTTEYVLKDVETGHLNKNQEEEVESNRHIVQEKTHPGYSKPLNDDEESIGPNEFHYSTLDSKITDRTDDNESDSSENILRRAAFETKNVRNTQFLSSDEEMDLTDEDFEPVEEIRAPREFGIRESLHRASVDTQESPALAFERRASADRLEDISSDSHEFNTSVEKDTEKDSSKDLYHTPPLPQTNDISGLDEIWSVSPMDVEHLLETSQDKKRKIDTDADSEPTLRRKRKNTAELEETIKRKERKDIAIQTSSNRQGWEDIRTNFFVGKPLMLRLCSCQDHVCSKQIN